MTKPRDPVDINALSLEIKKLTGTRSIYKEWASDYIPVFEITDRAA
jgi:hypothetical protein